MGGVKQRVSANNGVNMLIVNPSVHRVGVLLLRPDSCVLMSVCSLVPSLRLCRGDTDSRATIVVVMLCVLSKTVLHSYPE